MTKIPNKFIDIPEYNCFGCAPDNPHGLKLEFFEEGSRVIAIFKPDVHFTGYKDIVHGGIQATIADECAAWAVEHFHGKTVVTKTLTVSYHKPLYMTGGEIRASAAVHTIDSRHVTVTVEIHNANGDTATTAEVFFRIVPERMSEALFGRKKP